MRGCLSSRRFRSAASAHALSATAQSLTVVAMAVYVYDRTHSAGWMGLAAAVRLLPPVLFSPLGGLMGDRHDRRRVLIACNSAAAVAALVLAGMIAAGAPVAGVLAMAFVIAAVTTADYPAMVASTPWLVEPGQLVAANTVVSTVESAAFMVGPGLGGILLAFFAPSAAFAAQAVLFLAAAVTIVRTAPWDRRARRTAVDAPLRDGLGEGLAACAGAEARRLLLVLLATELLYGCTIVLLVLVTDGAGHAGLLTAAFAGGAVAAVLVVGPLVGARRAGPILIGSALASGLPIAMLAFTRSTFPAYALLAVAGVASTVVEVQAKTLLQRAVGHDVMARVFGLLDGGASVAILAGSVLTPVLVAAVGVTSSVVAVGAVLPVVAVLPLLRNHPILSATNVPATSLTELTT